MKKNSFFKKHTKKLISAVAVLVLVGSLLTGCTTEGNTGSQASSLVSSAVESTVSNGAETGSLANALGDKPSSTIEKKPEQQVNASEGSRVSSAPVSKPEKKPESKPPESQKSSSAVPSSQAETPSSQSTSSVPVTPPVSKPIPAGAKVALTFDDGPNGKTTERILKTLQENDGKGTFFMLGNRVGSFPDTVRKVYESGSEIGNHSYDHASLTSLSVSGAKYQIEQPQKLISGIVPYTPKLFRPPYGASNPTVRSNSSIPFVLWSIDTMDWKTRDRDSVVKAVLNSVQDGDIILMHDLYTSTADACEIIIPELKKRGYQLVTVSELLESEGVVPVAGKVYS